MPFEGPASVDAGGRTHRSHRYRHATKRQVGAGMRLLLCSSILTAAASNEGRRGRSADLERPRRLRPEAPSDEAPRVPAGGRARLDEGADRRGDETEEASPNPRDGRPMNRTNAANGGGDRSALGGLAAEGSAAGAVGAAREATAGVNEALVAAMDRVNNNGDRSALDGLDESDGDGGKEGGKNFKEWFTTVDSHGADSNDSNIDWTADASHANLTQSGFVLGSAERSDRHCGMSYDDAVENSCSGALSCQFQTCPSGMVCYVIGQWVMLEWCDGVLEQNELDGAVVVGSSAPTEVSIEMPAEKDSLSPSLTPSPTNNPTLAPATASPTAKPTKEPSNSPTRSPSSSPTAAPVTASPTAPPSKDPTASPTEAPTYLPSDAPTLAPATASPTTSPTAAPTYLPSDAPTLAPATASPTTKQPSQNPTTSPSGAPTYLPSDAPTLAPATASPTTKQPSQNPTTSPSEAPTYLPSDAPTLAPATASPTTKQPSQNPTTSPSEAPTYLPSDAPTLAPMTASPTTKQPSQNPTTSPSESPTYFPSGAPTLAPVTASPTTKRPSRNPTTSPTEAPTYLPSDAPTPAPVTASPTTIQPTESPSYNPTDNPSAAPTPAPVTAVPTTKKPTAAPSNNPTSEPTATPTYVPSDVPTNDPTNPPFTASPTESPSSNPTYNPSAEPTNAPVTASPTTKKPTAAPSDKPTTEPTVTPTYVPSDAPTKDPTVSPSTSEPSKMPSASPTDDPTPDPTNAPVTASPTTHRPTAAPSNKPTEEPTAISLSANFLVLPPTKVPTKDPTTRPITAEPSKTPSASPTYTPSSSPVKDPTVSPTNAPVTKSPTTRPSKRPTASPTTAPTKVPTKEPTIAPITSNPSEASSTTPSVESTEVPSHVVSEVPSKVKSEFPSVTASGTPSMAPSSSSPTVSPSQEPITASPTTHPSNSPTSLSPTASPSDKPTTLAPSKSPTDKPTTLAPTTSPSNNPTSLSPTASPSDKPTTLTPSKSPTDKPTTLAPTRSPSNIPSSLSATDSPSETPMTAAPSMSPSNDPTVKSWMTWITSDPPSQEGTAVSSSASQTSGSTPSPSTSAVTTSPINLKNPVVIGTMTPSGGLDTTYSPSISPSTATLHPNDKFWKHDPTISPSLGPDNATLSSEAQVPTQVPSSAPNETREHVVVDFPNLDYVLLTTDGEISRGAVEDAESAIQTFLSAELAVYYGKSFSEVKMEAVDVQVVVREVDLKKKKAVESLIRQRQLSEVNGTAITFVGEVDFKGEEPTDSELTEAIIFIGEEHNEYLVSNITSTGNSQLQDVIVVLVESTPTSAPSEWVEDFVRTPDAVVGGIETVPETARTSIIIVSICGIAALTMLLFVFATRNKAPANGEDEKEVIANAKSPLTEPQILPGEIDVESAQASFGISHNPNDDTGFDLNDNEESNTIISSVTDWNDYPAVDSRRANRSRSDSISLGAHVEVVNGSRSHEDITTWYTPDGKRLQSAAAINNTGTRTLEKNDESVVPKTWSAASNGKNAPTRLSLGAVSSLLDSDSDDSSQGNGESVGGFPEVQSSLDGAFPSEKNAQKIYDDLDSSIDHSTNYSVVGSRYDWSHIGTVDDTIEENYSCRSKSSAGSATVKSIPVLSKTLSQDTKDTSTSLNRFISDLVWLEKKITDESDAVKVREAVELTLKESEIERLDSYSYQCDSFSPRSISSEDEDATTISSKQGGSQPLSIICRDVFIPPGDLRIEIVSTMDGPMINRVQDELNGHLGKGDLIIAVDDSDTRALSAEKVKSIITSKMNLERKLTVLQFGGSSSLC